MPLVSFPTARKSLGSMRISVIAVYSRGASAPNINARTSMPAVVKKIVALPCQMADQNFWKSILAYGGCPTVRLPPPTTADLI